MADPEILYKYCPPERIDILESCCVHYTQRKYLNDVYELCPTTVPSEKWKKRYQESKAEISIRYPSMENIPEEDHESITRFVNEYLDSFYIFSLSSSWKLAPLWAYYAQCFGGFVLGFSRRKKFLENCQHVTYSDTYPNLFSENTQQSEFIYKKSNSWRHEHEWRSFFSIPPGKEDCVLTTTEYTGKGYLCKFQPDIVREVIIGHKMCQSYRESLSTILSDKPFSHVEVFDLTPESNNWKLNRKLWGGRK